LYTETDIYSLDGLCLQFQTPAKNSPTLPHWHAQLYQLILHRSSIYPHPSVLYTKNNKPDTETEFLWREVFPAFQDHPFQLQYLRIQNIHISLLRIILFNSFSSTKSIILLY